MLRTLAKYGDARALNGQNDRPGLGSFKTMLRFEYFGIFKIDDESGRDRRPKLMKARAILAVLGASKGHVRSRSWLKSLLWSDRQPEQAMSSLRTALADIRRHLGPFSDILISDHNEIRLDSSRIQTDLENGKTLGRDFMEGFDVTNAFEFEDWLRDTRQFYAFDDQHHAGVLRPAPPDNSIGTDRLFLASICPPGQSMTQMQADALIDNLAKATEDLALCQSTDIRGMANTQLDYVKLAQSQGCDLLLLSESAETSAGSMIRLKILDPQTTRLVWSKSLTKAGPINLDDPSTISCVAEFIDVLSEMKLRLFDWKNTNLPAAVLGMAGVRHIFRLGTQNYETAETLLKRAYERDPKAIYLAWRGYLRTYFIGEQEFDCKETVIDEGSFLSRRAIEKEPHNSMVLAAGAHVANMLHNSHEDALRLSSRALDLNRSNPLAWSTYGVASAFLGNTTVGKNSAKIGAKLSENAWFSAQMDVLASSASLVDNDIASARRHAELSRQSSPSFAPPLRFLSAIYCQSGEYDRAADAAETLRVQEPNFSLELLKEDGYPSESLRKAGLVEALPGREV